jgi:hypothetical protein
MDVTLIIIATVLAALVVLLVPTRASAHCDTLDGPAVRDGRAALATGNVNHALKWVPAEGEAEVRDAFTLSLRVRDLGPDARELADRSFLETLVRIHRAGEGEGFDGLKPAGTVLDPRVVAADAAIEAGDLAPLTGLVPPEDVAELSRQLDRAMALRQFDVDDLAAGRAYIAAYVDFFKLAEGEAHHHGHDAHADTGAHGHPSHEHGHEPAVAHTGHQH